MTEIVISEFMDEAAVTDLESAFTVTYDPNLVDRPSDLLAELSDARALIVRNRTQVRGDLLVAAPNLKTVGRLGVGLDNIDLAACEQRGISVHPASGANDLSVAEYVITTAMSLLRGAYVSTNQVIAGEWPRSALIGSELSGKRMGLIGLGSIAQRVATRARSLGMTVAAYDPFLSVHENAWSNVTYASLDQIFAQSDVISLHVPLTETTRGLVSANRLAAMKSSAILINAARGGIVDQEALANALKENTLAGAALDVFDKEPVETGDLSYFEGIDNLILTPHIAGVTMESNVRVSAMIAAKIRQELAKG